MGKKIFNPLTPQWIKIGDPGHAAAQSGDGHSPAQSGEYLMQCDQCRQRCQLVVTDQRLELSLRRSSKKENSKECQLSCDGYQCSLQITHDQTTLRLQSGDSPFRGRGGPSSVGVFYASQSLGRNHDHQFQASGLAITWSNETL